EGTQATLNGTLEWRLGNNVSHADGDRFQLIQGIGFLNDEFDAILLSDLPDHFVWDVSSFYTDGTIGVLAVPEPSTWALIATAAVLGVLAAWRRQRCQAGPTS